MPRKRNPFKDIFVLYNKNKKPWLNEPEKKCEVPVDKVPEFCPQNEAGSPSTLKKGMKLLPWPATFVIPKDNFSTDLKNHIENGELMWATKKSNNFK